MSGTREVCPPQSGSPDEVPALRAEAARWRGRVRKLLAALNARSAALAVAERALAEQLRRNAALHESVALAERQIEILGEDLARVAALRAVPTAARSSVRSELRQIRGIGARTAASLREAGISSVAELSRLDPDGLDDPAHPLHRLRTLARRDNWIGQANCDNTEISHNPIQ